VRKRVIRIGDLEFIGSEWRQSESVETVLIPQLVREYGPNHRLVHLARREAKHLREQELERVARVMERMADVGGRER
jgi:hypothetical protein